MTSDRETSAQSHSPRETTRQAYNGPRVCVTCKTERQAVFFPIIEANGARSKRCQGCRDTNRRQTPKDALVMAAKKARARERLAKLRRRMGE